MYIVDMYLRVRRACLVEGMSIREASRVFGLHRDTVRKMLSHPVPPGYRRKRPPHRPKFEPYTGVIDGILEDDLSAPKKQRHTAKRIFERLKKEHGFDGGYTIVKDYVRERRRVVREMFVPLSHPPGHAQCDFGQAWAYASSRNAADNSVDVFFVSTDQSHCRHDMVSLVSSGLAIACPHRRGNSSAISL